MDKAQELHDDIEVEMFKSNSIGHEFYNEYGFEFLAESFHEPTALQVLQLKSTAKNTCCWYWG